MRVVTLGSCLLLAAALPAVAGAGESFGADNLTTYGQKAWKESAQPVRPGGVDGHPFWNEAARRFIFAPAFDFKAVDGAARYHFEVTSEKTSQTLAFDADKPTAALSPVWPQVPVGYVTVSATGLKDDGTTAGNAGERRTWRAAPFNGPYHQPPVMPYDKSAQTALNVLLHKDYVEYWLKNGKPDPEYALYRYPSKIYGALVIGAVTQARLTTGTAEAERSIKLACTVADFMLSVRFPEGEAWARQVPTYWGPLIEKNKGKKTHMQLANHLTTMGVDAGTAFLDLYDLVGDDKYLQAAKDIAEIYKKTQMDNGTWPLYVEHASGKAFAENLAIPTAMINYFDRLRRDYKVTGLDDATKKALSYVMENPVKTFNWQGQFEDVKPRGPYKNQSREQACELAMYLYRNNGDKKLAQELIRYAEDQFVIWEQPVPYRGKKAVESEGYDSRTWITPSVQEQYVFWQPVGRSAGIMIDTFWEAYKATGDDIYKAKAESIANSFTVVQSKWNGDFPTFFTAEKMNYWLNSVVYPSKVLMNLENAIKNVK